MGIAKAIIYTISAILAAPFAVIFFDILMFKSMKEEDRARYLEAKKDLAGQIARNNITPEQIKAALGRVYSKPATIDQYRKALDKAVHYIRTTPFL